MISASVHRISELTMLVKIDSSDNGTRVASNTSGGVRYQ